MDKKYNHHCTACSLSYHIHNIITSFLYIYRFEQKFSIIFCVENNLSNTHSYAHVYASNRFPRNEVYFAFQLGNTNNICYAHIKPCGRTVAKEVTTHQSIALTFTTTSTIAPLTLLQ